MGHRVERIGDPEDPRRNWDLLGALTARIALAVPTLVVRADHLAADPVEPGHGRDDALSEPGVLPDLVELRRRERRSLEQRSVGHGEHADVVQPAPVLEARVVEQLGLGPGRKPDGEQGDPLCVFSRLRELATPVVTQLEGPHQGVDDGGARDRVLAQPIESLPTPIILAGVVTSHVSAKPA